ncbi:hypothetical protein [Nocardia asiatica]|uniref:hypothetical protein n=1 Tax=Nocardia asiatica TaxID=209252 RepID=UPI0024559721|nr:hypothetical protein [Nocardia asiatica]
MTNPAFEDNSRRIAEQVQNLPDLPRWWLSFVDTTKSAPPDEQVPGGGGFLGVSIVRAFDFMTAVNVAHALGCNPGGEVRGYPMRPDDPTPPEYEGRLLTREEIDYLDAIDPPESNPT